jgi:hypothetical protein
MRHKYLVKSVGYVWPVLAAALFNLLMAYSNLLVLLDHPSALYRFLVAISCATVIYCLKVAGGIMWDGHKMDRLDARRPRA